MVMTTNDGSAPTVINGTHIQNAASANTRSYTMSGGDLQLEIGSTDDYDVSVIGIMAGNPN